MQGRPPPAPLRVAPRRSLPLALDQVLRPPRRGARVRGRAPPRGEPERVFVDVGFRSAFYILVDGCTITIEYLCP
jgi:hypothetical protein